MFSHSIFLAFLQALTLLDLYFYPAYQFLKVWLLLLKFTSAVSASIVTCGNDDLQNKKADVVRFI